MKIKRIRLAGFKSFVEPAELRIEPGLTGIVGPNGCGKSNVLEAIRWAMGESSPKSMRGAGMDDVIFAGTAARPARDIAEVSLLIERAGAELSGDLQLAGPGEIEVTRRIERGAGSAYRVNGRDARARDVALIFADAATGAHSPALVSQGKIAQVIAARPAERRQMLEEAAGIAGLHVRRKDAEIKLRAAEANLARLGELLAEMDARAAALGRQAKAAGRYRRLSEQIRLAEARLIFARWQEAAGAADTAKQEAQTAVAAVEQAAAAQGEAARAQADAGGALAHARSAAQTAREHGTGLAHRLATLKAERDASAARVRELQDRLVALQADRAREDTLSRDARDALVQLEAEEAALSARLADAEDTQATLGQRTASLEERAGEAELQLGSARSAQAAAHAEAGIAAAALEAARSRHTRLRADADRLRAQSIELGDAASLVQARDAAEAKRQIAEQRLANVAEALRGSEADRAAAATERDRSESEVAAARAAVAALKAEAKALLQAVDIGRVGDPALDQIKVSPGYERALAAAVGNDLGADIGGAAPRRWAGATPQPGDPALPAGAEPLADHVGAPPALSRCLAQIGVVEHDDGSLVLATGQSLVTFAGSLRRWDGFTSSVNGVAAAERLIRLARLAEIELDLPEAAAALDAAQERSNRASQAIAAAMQAGAAARRDEEAARTTLRVAARDQDGAAAAIERMELRRSDLAERVAATEAELAEAQRMLSAGEDQVSALPDAREFDIAVNRLAPLADEARRLLAEARAEAASRARSAAIDAQRRIAVKAELANWQVRATNAAARLEELEARILAAQEKAKRQVDHPETLAAEIARIERDVTIALAQAEAGIAAERAAEQALQHAEHRAAAAGEALAAAREMRAGALARAENQELRRIEMGRISGERFECPPPLLPGKLGFAPDTIAAPATESASLDRLSAERERIGPVNLVAERELAQLAEERTAGAAEREELGLAINRLRGSIGSLNREGRARLLAAFHAVDRHFSSLFATLFDGGQAHLELTDADDPLEAGLEIMAQPPGKRLATLTLLSGGEQALTAIALIFALFLTNPAPICVLDEVDAPLDDANIERFCDLLDRMTAETETRYLIVTHNAVTMSRMQRLFGVTMIERGVSRLVSVDLGGAGQLLAAE